MPGKLYVVGTPIGNLNDFSPRQRQTLEEVDFIAAEDTRVTVKLLNHFEIKKPLVSYYEHNLRERGERFNEKMPFGVMLSVPSACLTAEEFVAHGCEFFVIETNDLIQYTHAVDRDLSIAERYYRPASHAMKKLIAMVVEAADAGQIPVTICGLAVGNPANTVQYLKLGLRSFSVSPQSLISVKRALLEADSRD